MKTKIGGFGVEFTRSNFDPAVLAVAKGRIIMFGCVDPSDTPVPSVASVSNACARYSNTSSRKISGSLRIAA